MAPNSFESWEDSSMEPNRSEAEHVQVGNNAANSLSLGDLNVQTHSIHDWLHDVPSQALGHPCGLHRVNIA